MDRDVKFNPKLICDNCGKMGAFDFMGDYYCPDCAIGCCECGCVFILDLSKPDETRCYECRKREGTECN